MRLCQSGGGGPSATLRQSRRARVDKRRQAGVSAIGAWATDLLGNINLDATRCQRAHPLRTCEPTFLGLCTAGRGFAVLPTVRVPRSPGAGSSARLHPRTFCRCPAGCIMISGSPYEPAVPHPEPLFNVR